MKLKTIDKKGNISLVDYDDAECRRIFLDRNSYVLELVHRYGEDYGGSQHSEEQTVSYQEISPELILVKNGAFWGVVLLTVYDYYNGGGKIYYKENILALDGSGAGSARSGSSFSNDDHDRWDYIDYYLVERPRDT